MERNRLLTSKKEDSVDLPEGEQFDCECHTHGQRQQCPDKELKTQNAEQATKPPHCIPFHLVGTQICLVGI